MAMYNPIPMADGKRFTAVDTLRGLAVLGMAISGMVTKDGLPAWMYHAQSPPPTEETNINLFGITWVDLVFPFFLFALGISIPLALDKKIKQGLPTSEVIKSFLLRGFNLAAFAIIGTHLRPYNLSASPGPLHFVLSLLGFLCIIGMFLRWPTDMNPRLKSQLFIGSWVLAILIMCLNRTYSDGKWIDLSRVDIIILVLANIAVSAGLIYYFTRNNPLCRLGIMGIAVMVFLARTQPGLAKTWWDWHPTGWNPIPIGYFYQLNYHKYLLVAIPGTFIGELLLRQSDIVADVVTTWTKQVSNWICGSSLLIPLCTCAGLYARQIPLTALLLTVYIVAVSLLAGKPQTGLERTIRGLLSWATGLLAAGMFAEPIEGGIRKAEPTISYFLVSGGLACIFLIGLTILHEEFRQDKRLRWVTGTGTNPILGYAVITLLVMGFEGLFNLGDLVGNLREHVFHGNAWFVMCWAAVKTTFIAFFCSKMSQHKLFLRA